jgi:hypothetical protein
VSAAPLIFEVTVDATDAADFRAALDKLVRQGTRVPSARPLAAGTACQMRIVSRSGAFEVLAEGGVVKPIPGEPLLLITPTKFGKIVATQAGRATPPPSPAAFEDATSAIPLGRAVPEIAVDPGAEQAEKKEEPPELQPFELLGNYQILKHLGGGGMAEVYLARSVLAQGVDKVVALKTVRRAFGPETKFGSMFLNEARVSATLQHPNLVQVFDFGEAAGRPYLAMEHVHGRDLGAILRLLRKQKKPASAAVAVAVGIKLCEALEYVHGKRDLDGRPLNLVHRDVSPANMLLTVRSELKLMDFGVAAATGLEQGDTAGLLVGKLSHMPPEQMKGGEASASWDLYPVGVTLYQLLALNNPWQGNPRDYLLMPALQFGRPQPSKVNATVPPVLDALVHRATRLDAAARHQTAKALREELEAVQKVTGTADLGAWVQSLFGDTLVEEERQLEALTAEARRRSARNVPAFLRPLVAPLAALRRQVVYSRPYLSLQRRPWLLRLVTATLVLGVLGGIGGGAWRSRDRGLLREQLARADAQVLAGRLTGQASDDALDVLLAARRTWPNEPRIVRRLELLAAKFEGLGTLAIERENQEEAAAHLEAALQADPARASVKQKLHDIEEAVRARSRDKVVQSQ